MKGELVNQEETEQKFSLLLDSLPEATTVTNENGTIIACNQATLTVFGYSKEELVGKNALDLFGKKDQQRAREHLEKTLKQGEARDIEYTFVTNQGREFLGELSSQAIKDASGNITGLITLTKDITERKQLEEKLREAEEKYRVLVENSPNIVFIYRDGAMDYVNRTLCGRLGWKFHEATSFFNSLEEIMPQQFQEPIKDSIAKHLSGKKIAPEITLRKRDGSEAHVKVLSDSTTYQGKTTLEVLLLDITEQKQMEKQLQRYSDHLEEIVQEQTKRLKDTERMAAIGEMAGIVGHDLRNPLQAITNTLYIMRTRYADTQESLALKEDIAKREIESFLNKIEAQTAYINKIASDLQEYAKPITPQLEETDVHTLLSETLSTIDVPELVEVSILVPKDLPKLIADPVLMRRVFTNLIINALQAMPQGGKLTINASETDKDVRVSVKDTGGGISKETLSKLFKPRLTTKLKGTGFGLSLCQRLVEAHGGTIIVESEEAKYSIFTVQIPRVYPKKETQE